MRALEELSKKMEIYSNEPSKYYSLQEGLNKTIAFYKDNFPDHALG